MDMNASPAVCRLYNHAHARKWRVSGAGERGKKSDDAVAASSAEGSADVGFRLRAAALGEPS